MAYGDVATPDERGFGHRALEFVHRHAWSLPLALLASITFLHLASEVAEGELDPFDAAFASLVDAWRGRADVTMLLLTRFGDPIGMGALTVAACTVLVGLGRRRDALFLTTSGVGVLCLNTLLKLIFHRGRPDALLEYLLPMPASFSFPSGHAMGATGVLGSVALLAFVVEPLRRARHVVATIAALLAVGIALSRIYFGLHFPSDVLGGMLAGAAWVSAWAGWFYPRLLPHERRKHPEDAPPPD